MHSSKTLKKKPENKVIFKIPLHTGYAKGFYVIHILRIRHEIGGRQHIALCPNTKAHLVSVLYTGKNDLAALIMSYRIKANSGRLSSVFNPY